MEAQEHIVWEGKPSCSFLALKSELQEHILNELAIVILVIVLALIFKVGSDRFFELVLFYGIISASILLPVIIYPFYIYLCLRHTSYRLTDTSLTLTTGIGLKSELTVISLSDITTAYSSNRFFDIGHVHINLNHFKNGSNKLSLKYLKDFKKLTEEIQSRIRQEIAA